MVNVPRQYELTEFPSEVYRGRIGSQVFARARCASFTRDGCVVLPPTSTALGGDQYQFEKTCILVRLLLSFKYRSLSVRCYGISLSGHTAKVTTQQPEGRKEMYLIKVRFSEIIFFPLEVSWDLSCARANIHVVSPTVAPRVYAWGKLQKPIYLFHASKVS